MSLALITVSFDPPVLGTQKNAAFSIRVDKLFGTDLPLWTTQANALAVSLVGTAASANYSANSETEHDIGTGEKTFEIDTGKIYVPGQFLTIVNTAAPENGMYVRVKTHDLVEGELVVDALRVFGSGADITAWSIGLSGPQGIGGDVNPPYAGKGRYVVWVKEDETGFEYVRRGWVELDEITAAELNGQSTVSFTGIDSDEYPGLMVTGSATPASSCTISFEVNDGTDTETVGTSGSGIAAAVGVGLVIDNADVAYPMCRTAIHTAAGTGQSAGRVPMTVSPITRINFKTDGPTFNNAGGLKLWGRRI